MPYSIEQRGEILTVLVTAPTPADVPMGLSDIQRRLDGGGISEVHIGYDESAWRTGWAVSTLTAFETSMRDRAITVRILGVDARLHPTTRAS